MAQPSCARLLLFIEVALCYLEFERKENTMVTENKEATLAKMDEAAEKAVEDFKVVVASEPNGVEAVARWWKDHYIQAGHKRLARILMAIL